jgi:hypothetical protein
MVGFWDMRFADYVTLGGFVLTVVGLIVGLRQLFKIRKSADAATAAANLATQGVQTRIWISDVTAQIEYAAAVAEYIRSDKFHSALLRMTDLRASLGKIVSASNLPGNARPDLEAAVAELTRVEKDIQSLLISGQGSAQFKYRAVAVLGELSDLLNRLVGQELYKSAKQE